VELGTAIKIAIKAAASFRLHSDPYSKDF
jgi:hypothetical protein